jgi:FkbM family methyltransferase
VNPKSFVTALNRHSLWHRHATVWNFRLHAPTFDRLVYLLMHRFGRMGLEEKAYLASVIRPGMHIADVGANIGLYSLHLAQCVGPAGRIYAFEPNECMASALRENLANNNASQAEVFACAVGAASGQAVLQRSTVNSGDSWLGRPTTATKRSNGTVVAVRSLDDALAGRRVDFIKMDIQGWEVDALRGATALVDANPGLRIYFEFWPHGLRRAGTGIPQLDETLHALHLTPCLPTTGEPVELTQLAATLKGKAFTNLLAYRR